MMQRLASRFWTQGTRDFLVSLALLSLALLLAISSSSARRSGQASAAVVLSVTALLVTGFVTALLVPRLLRRVNLGSLGNIGLFRVTRRGGLFVFLVILIGFSTFNTGNNLLVLVLSFLLAALLVSGMVSNLVLHRLRVSLNLPGAIHAGQRAMSWMTLHNEKKYLPAFAVALRSKSQDESSGADFFLKERHVPYLEAGGAVTTRIDSVFPRRGVYPVTGFQVRTKFPFGFFFRGREVEASGKITVYPALTDVKSLFRRFPVLYGPVVGERRGVGTGLYNIRDHNGSDEARFIHWKSTAKLSRLMVKEFVEERDHSLQLVLSTWLPERSDTALDSFEKVLSHLASLATFYFRRSIPFSFYSGAFEASVFGGEESFASLMEYLAWVEPADQSLLEQRRIGRSAVVFAAVRLGFPPGIPVIDYLRL